MPFCRCRIARAQVGFSYAGGPDTTVSFPCGNDTYYIICSSDFIGPPGTPGITYTLTGSWSVASVPTTTTIYPGVDLPGSPLNVTVKVTAQGATPTGSVTLTLGSTTYGPQTLSNGSTVFNIATNPGTGTLGANYAGSPGYLPSSGTATLMTGIPNTRLAPPAGHNADLHYALALPRTAGCLR